MKRLIVILSLAVAPAFAQEAAQKPQEVIVRVQTEAPKPVAPPAQTAAQKASEWVQLGGDVGSAIGSGLKSIAKEAQDATFGKDVSVIDGLDKLSKTDAGKFTMAAIAWKIAGKDAIHFTDIVMARVDKYIATLIHIGFGIPALAVWTLLAFMYIRRMYFPYRVIMKKEGWLWWAKKEYKFVNEDIEWSEGRITGLVITLILYVGISCLITFAVIL